MGMQESSPILDRREWLWLAALITLAAHGVPYWICAQLWFHLSQSSQQFVRDWVGPDNFWMCFDLAFGLFLALSAPRRSGLCIGEWRPHWRGLLVVCGLPVVATALVYPQLSNRPFTGSEIGIWLISPLAQDLVFVGFLYGRLEPLFPEQVHPLIPLRWAMVVTSTYFAAWHLPGILDYPGFTMFQVLYCFFGGCFVGLARQWTGSILPVTLTHMACNAIAWAAN
jgi:membrane protease YdiL (CAAX protease family)